ncbi:MAG: AraC family transcriptional regulator [Tannerella sp.]|jgi:AraC-like DNA-binding protein/mannose-6-phosphate isomerase-like protein (cupin superfamily)|nr:AraC family transcriptional regulator [Tannerella sp.]
MDKEDIKRHFILLNAGYASHHADWNWKNICSPFARIHFVRNGTAKIIREDGIYELKKNHLYLTPSYVKHSYECKGALELFYIHIYEDTGRNPGMFDLIQFPVEVKTDSLIPQLIKRLIKINPGRELQYYDPRSYDNTETLADNIAKQKYSPIAFELETQGILKQIISRFLIKAEYKNEHIEKRILKSLYYIHKNMDKGIDIDLLAEICYLTKDHFIRLFKKEMGCTPGKYINQKKIETAQLRILIQGMTIKDTAYSLGFDNISYFNRLFKKLTGETPGEYKKKIQP